LKPTRYLKIVSSSVVRNIQIDLKYKFLLLTDVAWLVIDIFAFTLLGGMVDGATDVTYAMDLNVDVIDDDLLIYIYDVENDYFEFSETGNQTLVRLMEHRTGGEFDRMDGIPSNPDLTITIDDNIVLNHSLPTAEFREFLRFGDAQNQYGMKNRVLIFDLGAGESLLDETRAVHRVDMSFTQGKDTTTILKGQYFGFDSFTHVVNGSTAVAEAFRLDISLESLTAEKGIDFVVLDDQELPLGNVSIFVDGEKVGITNIDGILAWETDGEPVVHFQAKGKHEVWAKLDENGTSNMLQTSFLLSSQKNRLGIDYNLTHFFLVGVIFWAFFHKSYDDTVNTIPEEASRGTIGFLVTNNVNISTLLLSRNVASSIKTFVITMIFVITPILLVDYGLRGVMGYEFKFGVFDAFNYQLLPLLLLVFLLMWFFMLVVSLLISSLNIVFKKVTPAAQMILYALKVLTGYYFPLEALDEYQPGLSDQIKFIPIVKGAYFILDVIIIGKDPVNAVGTLGEMVIGTVILAVFSLMFYKYLEYKSQRWGSLEFY
jgi:ABC-type polysaccharide/polyol phosphate export permease